MSLPAFTAYYAKQDAWIVAGISAFIAALCVFIITTLGGRFYKYTFYGYTCKILSRPVGVVICLLFAIKMIFTAAFQLRIFCEIIRLTILPHTPSYATGILIIVVAAYASSKGIETRARLAEILFLVVFLPMLLVIVLTARDADYTNVMPLLTTQPQDMLVGGFWNLISFTGIEFCLFAPIYVNRPEKLRIGAVGAVVFVGIIMCFVTLVTVCAFGYAEVTKHTWPVFDMINSISMPGSFIERQDAVIMSFWIVSVFATLSACLFFSGLLMKDVVKKGKHSIYIAFCAGAVYVISVLPESVSEVYEAQNLLFSTLGVVFMLILPFIMLVIARLRRLGDEFEK